MTTTKHRFQGPISGVCQQSFGGVAMCSLPRTNQWHYTDSDHPFTAHPQYPNECGWQLQNGEPGHTCAGSIDDPEHHQPDPTERERPTVTMEYPTEEAPVVADPAWKQAHVYPPSDDGGEQVPRYTAGGRKLNPDGSLPPEQPYPTKPPEEEPPTERLEVEARHYRWTNNEGGPGVKDAPAVTDPEQMPEWERALQWLKTEDVALLYGPWPIRKFILRDLSTGGTESSLAMAKQLQALEALEQTYCLNVWRPEGAPYRVALLTWDWATGYSLEVACDELAAMYG